MTSLQRVLTTLGFNEPDKVPNFLLFSIYGAKETGMSIEKYFSFPDIVVEAQLKMHKKYRTDCLNAFYYASIETEAFGGTTRFIENGPPNAGDPIISTLNDIENLKVPQVSEHIGLTNVLKSIELLKAEVQDNVPIIGVVMSPFSIPVMQMGFDEYIKLIYKEKKAFDKLMQINTEFCVNWANAQLNAGATAICYFDPISSPSIVSPEMYKRTGFEIAKDTIAQIKGPTATHFASGRCLSVVDDVANTGTAIIGVGTLENISEIKEKTYGKLSILGNLNGVEMIDWTPQIAKEKVQQLIQDAAPGGGFILSDSHGEIPWQVSESVLLAISDAVEEYGIYPIKK